jgi:hypothetical protein
LSDSDELKRKQKIFHQKVSFFYPLFSARVT